MKFLLYVVIIIIIFTVLFGPPLSRFVVEDTSIYPDLEFRENTDQITDAFVSGYSTVFSILTPIANGALVFVDQFDEEYPTWWDEDQAYYYEQLMLIEDDLTWWDRMVLRLTLISKMPAGILEDLYEKYYNRSGTGGDF